MIAFVYAHHPCRSPSSSSPPSHLCASSSSTSSHTARRETATSSRYSYAITPNAHIPWQKALLLYYLIVVFERNTLYFSTLDALCMNPKGSQAFLFHIWSPSWTYLGHILDTSVLDANKQASVLLSALWTLRPRNEPCTPNTVAHVKYALQPQIYALFRPKMPFFVTRPSHKKLTNPFVGAST